MRLSESLYSVKNYGDKNTRLDDYKLLAGYTNAENSCLPARLCENKQVGRVEEFQGLSGREFSKNVDLTLSGCSIYIDPDISPELQNKVKLIFRIVSFLLELW